MIFEFSSHANLTVEASVDRHEAADQAVLFDELRVRTCCSKDGLSVGSHHPAVTPPPPSPDIDVIRPWYDETRIVEKLCHVWKVQIGLQRNKINANLTTGPIFATYHMLRLQQTSFLVSNRVNIVSNDLEMLQSENVLLHSRTSYLEYQLNSSWMNNTASLLVSYFILNI